MIARPLDTARRPDGDRRARALLFYALLVALAGAVLHHVPGMQSYRSWVLTPAQPLLAATGSVRAALLAVAAPATAAAPQDAEAIRMEAAALRVRASELEDELNTLRATLGLEPVTGRRGLVATVTAGTPGFGDRTLVINKGLLQGVRVGAAVLGVSVDGRVGLVGRVLEAGPAMAKVTTILDPACRIAVRLRGEDGFVFTGSSRGGAGRLDFVPRDLAVSVGDSVVTAPEGAHFPAGFVVGTVAGMGTGNGVFHDLRVRPMVDVARVRYVWVMGAERAPGTAGAPGLENSGMRSTSEGSARSAGTEHSRQGQASSDAAAGAASAVDAAAGDSGEADQFVAPAPAHGAETR